MVPCCAIGQCDDDEKTGQMVNAERHDDHEDDCKNCSPFAVCANCTGFTNVVAPFTIVIPGVLSKPEYADLVISYFPEFFTSCWQPPKIA